MRRVLDKGRMVVWLVTLGFLGAPLATWSHMARHQHLRSKDHPGQVVCTGVSSDISLDGTDHERLSGPTPRGRSLVFEDCPFVQFQQSGQNLVAGGGGAALEPPLSSVASGGLGHSLERRSVPMLCLAPSLSPPLAV